MSSASLRAITALAVVGAAGAATWLATRPSNDAAPAVPAASSPIAAYDAPAPPAVADVIATAPLQNAVAAPQAPAGTGSVKFPDGSVRSALNGVTEALEIPWPAGHPWSPIVETVAHNGCDWFRHADGSFTTTIVRTETVGGQVMQIPLCYTPSVHSKTPSMRQ